jgi:hypothetical protein
MVTTQRAISLRFFFSPFPEQAGNFPGLGGDVGRKLGDGFFDNTVGARTELIPIVWGRWYWRWLFFLLGKGFPGAFSEGLPTDRNSHDASQDRHNELEYRRSM